MFRFRLIVNIGLNVYLGSPMKYECSYFMVEVNATFNLVLTLLVINLKSKYNIRN